MPRIPTENEFLSKYKDFFDVIKNNGLAEIKKARSPFNNLETPFNRVISLLINKQSMDSVERRVRQIKTEDRGKIMIATFFIEMDIVISLTQKTNSANKKRSVSKKEILTAAKKVTNSIAFLFTPQNRPYKLFILLDDMLSLIIDA